MLLIFILFFSSNRGGVNGYQVGDCGIKYNDFVPSISSGTPAKLNQFPWHVAIYRLTNNTQYYYICGGSIIDSDIVITAAHCVFDETKNDVDYRRMYIATGKHNSSWEHRDVSEKRFETGAQRIEIFFTRPQVIEKDEEVHVLTYNENIIVVPALLQSCPHNVISKKVPKTYRGMENRYQDDIALLALNDSIKFSDTVMPICLDWGTLFEPNDGEIGTIVGWGRNENNTLSEKLMVANARLLNLGECRNNIKSGYTSYLTSDKFCVSKSDKSSVEDGDSGGALSFSRKRTNGTSQYFLKGILSGREKTTNNYVLFTNISNHMSWVNSTQMAIKSDAEVRKVCGIRNPATETNYISRYEEYPWMATIYMTKNNKFFGIRCVGTIIHRRAIITNAWCIQKDKRPQYKGVEYKILVGKNELNMREEEETQQELNYIKAHPQENYVAGNIRSENEMVILIVDDDIKFSKSVAPICLDLDKKFPIVDHSGGMITSWDIDECHCQVQATYKYLDIENCSLAFPDPEEYETHITSDKVCGKYVNGTRFMHSSDVGSGYFFLKNGTTRYYLQGIVSKARPTYQDFLTFTNVELNLRWISDIIFTIYNSGGSFT